MKVIQIFFACFFACNLVQAQVNFAGITNFSVNGQTYIVDHYPGQHVYIKNSTNTLSNTPIVSDSFWYEGIDELPIDWKRSATIIQNIVTGVFSPIRYSQLKRNYERIDVLVRFDNTYRIKEIGFTLNPNTVLTRNEVYQIESALKNTLLIYKQGRSSNFNWLFLEVTVDFR